MLKLIGRRKAGGTGTIKKAVGGTQAGDDLSDRKDLLGKIWSAQECEENRIDKT